MKTTKKLLGILLALSVIFSLCMVVSADEEAPAAGIYGITYFKQGDTAYEGELLTEAGLTVENGWYLELKDDGTFTLSLGDEGSAAGEWDGKLALTVDGATLNLEKADGYWLLQDGDEAIGFALSDAEAPADTGKDTEESEVSEPDEEEPETDKADEDELGAPEITENTVVLDDDVVKLTITGIELDSFGYYVLSYTAENKTDKAVNISTDYAFINGVQNDGAGLYISLDASGKLKDTSYISPYYLTGVEHIGKLAWVFDVYDAESYDHLDESYPYGEVATSLDGKFEQKVYDEGDVILDDDTAKIVYLGTRTIDDSYYIDFYVQNKTEDKDIYVRNDTLAFDGWQSEESLYETVYRGSCGYCYISPWSSKPSDYEVEAFTDLSEMKISVSVLDDSNFDTLSTSEEVTVNLKTASPFTE